MSTNYVYYSPRIHIGWIFICRNSSTSRKYVDFSTKTHARDTQSTLDIHFRWKINIKRTEKKKVNITETPNQIQFTFLHNMILFYLSKTFFYIIYYLYLRIFMFTIIIHFRRVNIVVFIQFHARIQYIVKLIHGMEFQSKKILQKCLWHIHDYTLRF